MINTKVNQTNPLDVATEIAVVQEVEDPIVQKAYDKLARYFPKTMRKH